MALQVVDRAMQSFGAEGVSQDQPLAQTWAGLRTLRFADGPDAVSIKVPSVVILFLRNDAQVHIQQIGQRELKRAPEVVKRLDAIKKKEKALFEKYQVKAHL